MLKRRKEKKNDADVRFKPRKYRDTKKGKRFTWNLNQNWSVPPDNNQPDEDEKDS